MNASQSGAAPLFIQLHAFTGCTDVPAVISALKAHDVDAVVYENVNDSRGVGIAFATRAADFLIDSVRPVLLSEPLRRLTPVPSLTMLGRSYLSPHDRDADDVLIRRPRGRLLAPDLRWAVWYPLRRAGAFERIAADEQRLALREHGSAGAEFAASGQAFDIRLACHGLDVNDNDFLIGIVGPELEPLSRLVERMRKTVQTSTYIEKLGPFFVGRVAWQSPL